MPLLQVRDFPEELYNKLSRMAKREKRSIAQETIIQLKKALDVKEERKEKLSHLFRELDTIAAKTSAHLPDPEHLIRQDRDR